MTTNNGQAEKLLPQNVEAEAAVLGSILIDPAALASVLDDLAPADFYREAHRLIFVAMCDLLADGTEPDLITLTDELARRGQLDEIGGVSFVSSLANAVPTSLSIRQYAQIVQRCAVLRQLIQAAGQIASVAYNEPDATLACDVALAHILRVSEHVNSPGQWRSFRQVLDDLGADVLARLDTDTSHGVGTGFAALDQYVVGMEPGDLIYLAGRPGSGKSALGLKIALQGALQCHAEGRGAVHVVTLEMSARQQARRLIADRTDLNTRYIRAGFRASTGTRRDPDLDAWNLFDEQRRWLQERIGERLWFRDTTLSLPQLRAQIMRAVREHGSRLVVVDQLDLFADGADKDEFQRVTKISRQLKQIARSCGVAILCMVQLSRKCEERRNKRPMLSDLRMSGQLEQDADMVWGIYRPGYYDPQNTDARFQQFAELLILKTRDGASGVMVPLWFQAEYTRFRDWPDTYAIPDDPTRNAAGE